MPLPVRRFALRDILILIIAMAVAFALARATVQNELLVRPSRSFTTGQLMIPAASLVLMSLSLAAFALSLTSPRPRLRRLVHQPGFMVSVAVTFNVVWHMVWTPLLFVSELLVTGVTFSPNQWHGRVHNAFVELYAPYFVMPYIVLALLIGMLRGLSFRRADWVEHLARLLGCLWVLQWILIMFRIVQA